MTKNQIFRVWRDLTQLISSWSHASYYILHLAESHRGSTYATPCSSLTGIFYFFIIFFLIKAHTRRYRSLIKNISLVLWVNFVQVDGERNFTHSGTLYETYNQKLQERTRKKCKYIWNIASLDNHTKQQIGLTVLEYCKLLTKMCNFNIIQLSLICMHSILFIFIQGHHISLHSTPLHSTQFYFHSTPFFSIHFILFHFTSFYFRFSLFQSIICRFTLFHSILLSSTP